LLLSRYQNIDFVYNLPWQDGIKLINKAIEKTVEHKDWEVWLSVYPNMTEETFVPFGKFKERKPEKPKKPKQTAEEMIAKAEELRKIHQGIHEGVNNNGNI